VEYFVGAAITLLVVVVANRYINNKTTNAESSEITYSQSHIYELIRPFLSYVAPPSIGVTQSTKFMNKIYLKIMVVKDKAYWIKDNTFYVAEVVDGEVKRENARAVDTMAMSKVELDEMLFIIEKLREEDNDSRGSGK
jgi:hypothetical protein